MSRSFSWLPAPKPEPEGEDVALAMWAALAARARGDAGIGDVPDEFSLADSDLEWLRGVRDASSPTSDIGRSVRELIRAVQLNGEIVVRSDR